MNNNDVGYWTEKKEKLKQKFPFITEKDLHYREGKGEGNDRNTWL